MKLKPKHKILEHWFDAMFDHLTGRSTLQVYLLISQQKALFDKKPLPLRAKG